MKKLLIALIAVLTLLAITLTIVAGSILASRKKDEVPPETTEITEAPTLPPITEETTEATTEATTVPTVSPLETKPVETTEATTAPTEPESFDGMEFKPMSRKVYATQRVNVRSLPKVKSDLVGKLEKDSGVEQIGVSKDGKWSRIIFQGRKCFVASEYLTTTKPIDKSELPKPSIQAVSDTVYATASLNVRTGADTGYDAIGHLEKGQKVNRVGITDNGWSKIEFNGGHGFVSSRYLSREDPDPNYTMVNETVYATETLNLREGASTDHKVAAKLQKNQSIQRIAVGDNGWSQVKFNDRTLYAFSKYLTKEAPAGAKPSQPGNKPQQPEKPKLPPCKTVDEIMYATRSLILYSGPGTTYDNMGSISQGKLLQRTGICENGWSRIQLAEKEVYVLTGYLTDKKPEASKPETQDPPKEEPPKQEEDGYVANAKTVYSTGDDVNVREAPTTRSKSLGKLSKGDPVDRLAVGDDGWSKITFKEQKAYVSSAFLAEAPQQKPEEQKPETEKPQQEVFEDRKDTIYAVDGVTVRAKPDIQSQALGTLYYGDSIERTGVSKNWSRVIWDGQTAYVYSKYISTEEPEMPDFGDTTTPGFPTENSPFIYQYLDMEGIIPHAVFMPVDDDGSKPLPLILSLHGSAEVGKTRDEFEQFHLAKVFREWEYTKLKAIPAIVVCPHISKDAGFLSWDSKEGADAIFTLLKDLKKNYDIDESRIILEGHSMGAQGAFRMAADDRASFQKLVIVSSPAPSLTDLSKIKIPVTGCVGGGPDSQGPKDSSKIYEFMTGPFVSQFGKDALYEGPYTHDDVAIKFFKKDEDQDDESDIIQWMLK